MHKTGTKDDEVQYEARFELPVSFGNVGAVLVQNEDHNEVFLKTIVLDGFPHGPLHFTCDSWIQPKTDSSPKRVFFANKVRVKTYNMLFSISHMENISSYILFE